MSTYIDSLLRLTSQSLYNLLNDARVSSFTSYFLPTVMKIGLLYVFHFVANITLI